ncbi:MAG: T9SS type A sorting domain-containing protein [Bacteroidota bacterium]
MKTIYRCLFTIVMAAGLQSIGSAQGLVFQEDFNYTAGTSLVANGWTVQTAGTPTINVANAGLSYTGYLGSNVGLAAGLPTTTGEIVRKNLTASQTSSVYISCLVNVNTITATPGYFLVTRYNTSNHQRGRIWVKSDGASGFNFGVSKSSSTTPAYGATSYSLNTTYLVVLKYTFQGTTGSTSTDDVLSLWVNPTSFGGAEDPSPLISNANDGGGDLTSLGSLMLFQGVGGNGMTVDGIRASTSWATILPTPPYYYNGSGDITDVHEWGLESNGTGSHPANFTANDQSFYIANNASVTLNQSWTVSGTNSKVVVNNGTNFTIVSGVTLTGTVDVASGGTLTLQDMSWPTFGTLSGTVSLSNAGGFSLAGDLSLPTGVFVLTSGNMDVNSHTLTVNGTLDCGTNLVLGNGTFTLSSGGSLRIGSVNGITTSGAAGNIQTTTRNFSTGATYTYKGTGTSLVTGDALPSTVSALTINLANASDLISLSGPVTTTGNLTFTNGKLKLGNNDLTLGTSGGGSASSYAITNGSGALKRTTTTNTSTKTFYLGSETEYRKAVITFGGAPVNTITLAARYIASDPGSAGYPDASITHHYIGGYWEVLCTGDPGQTYTMDLETSGMGGLNTITAVRMLKRANSSSAWSFAGTAANFTTTVSESGISGFSEFTIGGDASNPLPVELASFDASVKMNAVELVWKTATEVNNHGFEVERRTIDNGKLTMDNWSTLGFVEGNGTANTPKEYSFSDNGLSVGKYSYRLKQIDRDGNVAYSQNIDAEIASVPAEFRLFQNYPNPFNPTTSIRFSVPLNGTAVVKVFNAIGQETAVLFNGYAESGRIYTAAFDGSALSSGIYFTTLEFNGQRSMKKMILVK